MLAQRSCVVLVLALIVPTTRASAAPNENEAGINVISSEYVTVAKDDRISLRAHPPVVVMEGGRYPYLFCSAKGTLVCQAELELPAFMSKRPPFNYTLRMQTAVSRDGGATWMLFRHRENHDDVNIQGGVVQCRDGTILMLNTFMSPSTRPDRVFTELWRSRDDFRSLEGPTDAYFRLPKGNFTGSADDRGVSHFAARLHRSILEMPNGDLLTSLYGAFEGDTAPSGYQPKMLKTRVVVIRSRDRGLTWSYLATVGVDSAVGTEGYNEPVLARVTRGPHAGRLICLIRTGRELYGSHSSDAGATWARPRPVSIPGIDIFQIRKWDHLFGYDPAAADYVPSDSMLGAMVNPDLVEMENGVLACAVGVRIPARRYREQWRASESGNYLAFSLDGGDTWSHVVEFMAGRPSSHYMGIRETAPGMLYVVYDNKLRNVGPPGQTVGFKLEVRRHDAQSVR